MGKRHDKQWLFSLARAMRINQKSQKAEPAESPWYEGGLLWGAVGAVITLVTVYLGFALKDIRWFLVAAWPFCVLTFVGLCRAIQWTKRRHLIRVCVILLGSAASAYVLWQISHEFPPPHNQDVAQQFNQLYNKLKGTHPPSPDQPPSVPPESPKPTTAKRTAPEISLTKIDSSTSFNPNDRVQVELSLHVDGPTPLDVLVATRNGVAPVFHGDDPIRQKMVEDAWWKEEDKHSYLYHFQLTNAEGETMTMHALPLSGESSQDIIAGRKAVYFLAEIMDHSGKLLYEFCGYKDGTSPNTVMECAPRGQAMRHRK